MAIRSAIRNPQTWTRLQRGELRDLANEIGNEAVRLHTKWPRSGEGRAVKEITERISGRLNGQQSTRGLPAAFAELMRTAQDFKEIADNAFFQSHLANYAIPGSRFKSTAQTRVENAIVSTMEYIDNHPLPDEPKAEVERVILGVVPDQQLGPVYFEYAQSRLRIRHTAAIPDDADKHNADSAASAVIRQGRKLADGLAAGNVNRRVVEVIRDMVDRVKSKQDIIELGIANLAAQLVFRASEEEMTDLSFAELQAFGVALSMYVAQFPQWIRFSDNAAAAEYNTEDIRRVYETGLNLARDLEKAKAVVDPEIPRTLRWMAEAVQNPRLAARRAVYASIRTIENLISVVMRTFSKWLGKSGDGVGEALKTTAKTATIIMLLNMAASAGMKLAPESALGQASSWVGTASRIILKELQGEVPVSPSGHQLLRGLLSVAGKAKALEISRVVGAATALGDDVIYLLGERKVSLCSAMSAQWLGLDVPVANPLPTRPVLARTGHNSPRQGGGALLKRGRPSGHLILSLTNALCRGSMFVARTGARTGEAYEEAIGDFMCPGDWIVRGFSSGC